MVEWWSGGVVEWWSGGVVEWWSGGVVEAAVMPHDLLGLQHSITPLLPQLLDLASPA
ncbi:MAG: hypothetical protein ACO1SX_26065 [Actinomycetota bacterium]